ncbi:MAG TPA: metallophosphoesterase [Desulfobulbus sp.]|nr:metallophosphoesterase [Desulfobulbus sp.]
MIQRAGVLSDTHLTRADAAFRTQVERCFGDCDIIIHAGDLTDPAILEVFGDRTIHAVHGNMCRETAFRALPTETTFRIGRFLIGLTHGAHLGLDIESALWDIFPETDAMIYGHTHRAVCHRVGQTLVLNPGSFRATSRFGAPGTYAILEAGRTLQARIHELPPLP